MEASKCQFQNVRSPFQFPTYPSLKENALELYACSATVTMHIYYNLQILEGLFLPAILITKILVAFLKKS